MKYYGESDSVVWNLLYIWDLLEQGGAPTPAQVPTEANHELSKA